MTEEFQLLFRLSKQSFIIIGIIVALITVITYFVFHYLVPHITMRIGEKRSIIDQTESINGIKTRKYTPLQMTLDEMTNTLSKARPEQRFKQTVTILGKILPAFLQYLRLRPRTQAEANDLYFVYLQIFNLLLNIIPLESKVDYQSFFKKYQRELQFIDKRFTELVSIEWLVDMDKCLHEFYRFLSTKQLYSDFRFLDLRIIQYLLSKNKNLILDQEDGKNFYHLDEDNYNEFGVEIRDEYFRQRYFFKNSIDSQY